ncbi:MAG: penicillin-binding protein [Candidatus Pacebacteria bacterium]|nr:penicillin-binding protein [Candidatus Paceibacterota bacterium]
MSHHKKKIHRHVKAIVVLAISGVFIVTGLVALWVATLEMPDLDSFQNRKIIESTKIYDRTGTILLYDTGRDAKRTALPLSAISSFIQEATIAIEDSDFYTNIGIEPTSIIRAVLANLATGGYGQGASTITQQVVKNSLLTKDKTITRKIKEWVIAVRLTRIMSKDQILETYLNDTSYGGTIFGVEEASRAFFGRSAKDVTLAQAAYLAAIPQAPTYYSPYGTHRDDLTARQRLVLKRMLDLDLISQSEHDEAVAEEVVFLSKNDSSIRAPHFVMFVKDYVTQKYGEELTSSGGLRIITTLDYGMQEKAEDVVVKFTPSLESNFNASNTAMVAIDPKTGDILTMVGSRDYFDPTIDGNFNIALAQRQPGSTFKPFVYATAFERGYTPETVLFDVETEFSTECTVEGKPKKAGEDPTKVCYSPDEYDHTFPGPMSIREALAHSRNIPAVKALYLAGINRSIQTAENMGITSLTDPARYGLTLVLGGGEISLLELTSAYGVFANDGMRNPYRSVLRVEDSKGTILESAEVSPVATEALKPEIARQISDILSDESVRMESLKPIGESVGRKVAIKTGTTNDYRDVWAVGYTPNLVVGAWAGKNDNTPMKQNIAGLIIAPVWGAFMSQVEETFPPENFQEPPAPLSDNKPVLRGIWQGGISYWKDSISGKIATEYTPSETKKEVAFNNVHSILHWVNKSDPRGEAPKNPNDDSQYEYWEYAVRKWFDKYQEEHPDFKEATSIEIPTAVDDIHLPEKAPRVSFVTPTYGASLNSKESLNIKLQATGAYPAQKTEVYINGKYILTSEKDPLNISFFPSDVGNLSGNTTLSVVLYDSVFNKGMASTTFSIN